MHTLPLLIIGAGPFGLSMAAYAQGKNIEHRLVGRPMDFWRDNMPTGMYLRSACDWHYDPFDIATIGQFLTTRNLTPKEVEPLALDFYLAYVAWFQKEKGIVAHPDWVRQLDFVPGPEPHYVATCEDGRVLVARNVVLALGFRYFVNAPDPYPTLFPAGRWAHTCDLVDFAELQGKRVLILGGRQSAFEWAALLRDQGAAAVYMSYRHPTPAFETSDWTWVAPIVANMVNDPGWFRRLSAEEKEQVTKRLWAEGRLKLEPWLADRITHPNITLLPQSQVTACQTQPNGELLVNINDSQIAVDQVILATGYKVNIARVPFLATGNILPQLTTLNGFPCLDTSFQSNLPGLFFTSMCATQDFGPFMAFTAAVRASAQLIGNALTQQILS